MGVRRHDAGRAMDSSSRSRFHPIGVMRTDRRQSLIGRLNQPNEEIGMRGTGRVVFAATLLLIAGTLNIIYGIGALDDANIFVNDKR
jgi:hypothetical protein